MCKLSTPYIPVWCFLVVNELRRSILQKGHPILTPTWRNRPAFLWFLNPFVMAIVVGHTSDIYPLVNYNIAMENHFFNG
jgi:hypothetical protein